MTIIATEYLAAVIGGGSGYTSNLMVTKVRATALGCNTRNNTYANNLLVRYNDLYKPGTSKYCTCNTLCGCNTVLSCTCNTHCTCNKLCTNVSGTRYCTCNAECSCKTNKSYCNCVSHCTCNVKITGFSCPGYSGSGIGVGTVCSGWCASHSGMYAGVSSIRCNQWCYTNWCTTNSNTVNGYSGSSWCQGHCYGYTTCSCNTQCTCDRDSSGSICACNNYCTCNANGCSCLGHCTCNTICECNTNVCNCVSYCNCLGNYPCSCLTGNCSCQGHCTCNVVS